MQVLVLTGRPLSPSLVRDVADSGASGLLPKSASLSEVVETIPSLRDHAFAVDRRSLVSLCEADGGVDVPRRSRGSDLLTKREHDILSLLVSGVDLRERGGAPRDHRQHGSGLRRRTCTASSASTTSSSSWRWSESAASSRTPVDRGDRTRVITLARTPRSRHPLSGGTPQMGTLR